METINLIKKSLVITFASIIMACGAEILAIIFIPAFAAEWPVVGVADYSIDLQPNGDNKGVESGVFEGREINYPQDTDGEDNILNGSFNGLSIQFTIDREGDGSIKYTGKMIPESDENHNIKRIELSSSEGNLILEF